MDFLSMIRYCAQFGCSMPNGLSMYSGQNKHMQILHLMYRTQLYGAIRALLPCNTRSSADADNYVRHDVLC